MTLKRVLSALFPGTMDAQFDAGYRAAVDKILLLPQKVRLGNMLTLDADVRDCSFVGGAPAIQILGARHRLENLIIEHADIGIEMAPGVLETNGITLVSDVPGSEP